VSEDRRKSAIQRDLRITPLGRNLTDLVGVWKAKGNGRFASCRRAAKRGGVNGKKSNPIKGFPSSRHGILEASRKRRKRNTEETKPPLVGNRRRREPTNAPKISFPFGRPILISGQAIKNGLTGRRGERSKEDFRKTEKS